MIFERRPAEFNSEGDIYSSHPFAQMAWKKQMKWYQFQNTKFSPEWIDFAYYKCSWIAAPTAFFALPLSSAVIHQLAIFWDVTGGTHPLVATFFIHSTKVEERKKIKKTVQRTHAASSLTFNWHCCSYLPGTIRLYFPFIRVNTVVTRREDKRVLNQILLSLAYQKRIKGQKTIGKQCW